MSRSVDTELAYIESRVESVRNQLSGAMRSTGQRLLDSAERLTRDEQIEHKHGEGRSFGLNSIGEIQARGTRIDNLIGTLTALEAARAAIQRIKDESHDS